MKSGSLLFVSCAIISTFVFGVRSKPKCVIRGKNSDYRGKSRVLLELGSLHQQLKPRKLRQQKEKVAALIDFLSKQNYNCPTLIKAYQWLAEVRSQAEVLPQQKKQKQELTQAFIACQRLVARESERLEDE